MSSEQRYGRGMYRKVLMYSATPFERLSALYIGALRLARQGRAAAVQGNTDLALQRAERVSALVKRLDVCLDRQAAPELSENLSRLYRHIEGRLDQEGIELDPSGYDEVIAILEKLFEGFQEAEGIKQQ